MRNIVECLRVFTSHVSENIQCPERRASGTFNLSRQDLRPEFFHVVRRDVLNVVKKPCGPVRIHRVITYNLVVEVSCGLESDRCDIVLSLLFLKFYSLPDSVPTKFYRSSPRFDWSTKRTLSLRLCIGKDPHGGGISLRFNDTSVGVCPTSDAFCFRVPARLPPGQHRPGNRTDAARHVVQQLFQCRNLHVHVSHFSSHWAHHQRILLPGPVDSAHQPMRTRSAWLVSRLAATGQRYGTCCDRVKAVNPAQRRRSRNRRVVFDPVDDRRRRRWG